MMSADADAAVSASAARASTVAREIFLRPLVLTSVRLEGLPTPNVRYVETLPTAALEDTIPVRREAGAWKVAAVAASGIP
jgi:hypothetical protein